MASTLEIIIKVTDQFSSGFKQAESKMRSLKMVGDQLSKIGTGLTLGVTAPIVAIGAAATNAASDLNESMSKADQVFQKSAKEIQIWSQGAANAFGLSRQEALEAASSFGNMFKAMDVVSSKNKEMSTTLVGLAGDLASFNNEDPSDMLMRLRSGLVGAAEPLRPFGVLLSETRVKEKALALGLAETADALTEQDKVMARYQIILEDTKTAQGDFARTSEGLANQTRIMKAQFADAAAMLGQNLLPMAVKMVGGLNGMLESFNKMDPAMQKVVIGVGAVLASFGPILMVAGNTVKLFVAVKSLTAGITTAVPALASFGAGLKVFGASAWASLGPIGALAAAVAGLIALLNSDFGKSAITSGKQLLALGNRAVTTALMGEAAGNAAFTRDVKELGIPGFANGGAFTVGGFGGRDSQLVQFMATPGEPVVVGNPAGRGTTVINLHYAPAISTASQQEVETKLRPMINSILRSNPGRNYG